ncbi:MAG: PD-(D/E)XK nuclease family protein [Bacteroidales bacterium]
MKKKFLELCAQHMYANFSSEDFANMTLVFPSKRAITFFKNHIGALISKPVFLPRFTTIQDLFSSVSSKHIPEKIVLIYILYDVYKKHTGSSEDFDSFYSWGEMLLRDFHDIDTYLISADLLFSNISSLKSVESSFSFLTDEQIEHISRFWDVINVESDSDAKKNFVAIWNVLTAIYSEFKEELRTRNYAYQGMIARDVIEEIMRTGNFAERTFCFVGFNALNECEKKLCTFLKNRSQAYFYWDYDVLYTQSAYNHEAGYFISHYLRDYPNELDETYFSSFDAEKSITIRAVPQTISQVKICGDWIKNQTLSSQKNDAAVVLADEQLINPLLTSIPDTAKYNVSLGYPVRSTQAYTLFVAVLDMYMHIKNTSWYYKDVLRVCESPLLHSDFMEALQKVKRHIVQTNAVYVSEKMFEGVSVGPYFKHCQDPDEFIDFLEEIVLISAQSDNCSLIEQSVFYAIYKEIKHIKFLKQTYNIPIVSIRFVARLLTKSLASVTVPIEGEPLEGVQIMGVLETRALDFSSLIILSMNEEVFPKASVGSSFIPYSLRTGFGMPTVKEQTAIYSYYFYRLLQRATDVTIVYSAQTDGVGKGEMSRYVLQLLYNTDLPKCSVKHYVDSFSVLPQKDIPLSFPKDEKAFDVLNSLLLKDSRPLSPSAITLYVSCPLRFYFRYIRKIVAPDKLTELPDERQYGNIFHNAIENIYKKYTNTQLTSEHIEYILDETEYMHSCIRKSIEKEFQVSLDTQNSVYTLLFSTIKKYIYNTLKHDLERAPFYIVGTEYEAKHQLTHTHPLYIGGSIDRLDNVRGKYVVIDYKTGQVKNTAPSIEDLFSQDNIMSNNAILQSMIYAYIVKNVYQTDTTILLYFIRKIHSDEQSLLRIGKQPMESFVDSYYKEFEHYLFELIDELYNPEIPFTQTTNKNVCNMCDYAVICKKNV